MTTVQKIRTTSEDEIRDLMASYFEAIPTKDTARITSHYSPDVLAFDAIGKLQFKGRDAYKEHWDACMNMCPATTNMVFEMHDLQVSAAENVGFGHFLVRCGGTNEKGEGQVGWMRATVCLERRGGEWAIVHEHYSAPFDPESQKALFDLEP